MKRKQDDPSSAEYHAALWLISTTRLACDAAGSRGELSALVDVTAKN